MSKPTVGWIGLGAMGSGMAKSLVQQGFPVQVYDVWAPSVEAAVAAGAKASPTPAEAAKGAQIIGLMVVNAVQVEDVLFGAGRVAEVLEKGSSIICFSTVPPSFLATVAERLAALGIGLCDSPVSGGSTRAADGTLAVMTSGTSESIQAASPVLEGLTRQPGGHSIVGSACGDASSFKLINQVFCAAQIAMASESMAFGAKLGLNPRLIYNTARQMAGDSFMLGHRVPWQLRHDGQPKSAMTIIYKDSGIVNEEARLLGFPAPLSSAAEQLFTAAIGAGFAREDDGLLVKLYEKFGGPVVAEQGAEEDSIAKAQELKITPAQVGKVSVLAEGKLGAFVDGKVQSANDSANTAGGTDVLVVAVDNLLQAESALGSVSGYEEGTTVVLLSNSGPTAIAGLQQRLQAQSPTVKLVDAAISFKNGPVVIASGDDADLAKAASALQAISPNVHYLPGGVGTAAKMKAVDSLLSAVHLATAAEAVNFAHHKGMNLDAVMRIINSGAAASYMAADRVGRMRQSRQVEAQHTIEQMLADLAITLAEARKVGLPLFLGAAAYSQFLAAQGLGLAKEDDSTVGRLWEHMGVKVRGV